MSEKIDKIVKMEMLHLANKEIGLLWTGKERYAAADKWLDRLYGRFPNLTFDIDDKLCYIREVKEN